MLIVFEDIKLVEVFYDVVVKDFGANRSLGVLIKFVFTKKECVLKKCVDVQVLLP